MEPITLLVGCYADKAPGVVRLEFSPRTLEFTQTGHNKQTINPSFLVQHGEKLFAANEIGESCDFSSFTFENDAIERKSQTSHPGSICCHITVTDNAAYGSNYGAGTVVAVEQTDGVFGALLSNQQHQGEQPRAHSTVLTPEGEFLLAADLGVDRIYQYEVLEDGALKETAHYPLPQGSGPRHMVFDSTGSFLFVVSEYSNQIFTFRYDNQALELTATTDLPPAVLEAQETFGADIHLHPRRNYLLASFRGPDILSSHRIGENGALELIGTYPTGGRWPRNFAIIDDYVFITNQQSHEITVCKIDSRTGEISPPLNRTSVQEPSCIIQYTAE